MTDNISFLMVQYERLPNEPNDWNHIIIYSSRDDLKSCRDLGHSSMLLYNDEFEELSKLMGCKVITSNEFKELYWKDDYNIQRNGTYKQYTSLNKKTLAAIKKCKKCDGQDCYRGCKTYEYLCGDRDD